MKNRFYFLIVFLYLNIALMIIFPLWFMLVQIITEFFCSLYYDGQFNLSNIHFMKAIKTGLFCGVLSGSGYFWLYYKHQRKKI